MHQNRKSPSTALKFDTFWPPQGDINPNHFNMSASLAGRKVGAAQGWYQPNGDFTLEKIEVFSDFRSHGYGGQMIAELRAKARRRKCTRFVFHSVHKDNINAIRLYTRLGATPEPYAKDRDHYVLLSV